MRSACDLEQELPAPRSAGGPAFVPGGGPGLDVGAADPEVESLGARRIPFVVQSEQDNMLRYHVSLLSHCLNVGAGPLLGVPCQQAAPGCMAYRQGQGPTRRVQTAEDNGVLEGIIGKG